jgi:hypothetical protein
MDELALLKDMADRTPLPSETDLAPARARLTALTQASAAPPPVPRSRRRRLVVSGVTVVGLAAAITAVVSFGGLDPVGIAPPDADAVAFLHQAADAARKLPTTPPRPDQFVYTKSQTADGLRETWLSADGTHDGLIEQERELESGEVVLDSIPMPGCRHRQRKVLKGDQDTGLTEPCTPDAAYRADLPTDAAGMRKYLGQAADAKPKDLDTLVHFAFTETYVSPQTMVALFEVMADFPGLTIDEDATDLAGHPGIGLSWPQPADQDTVTLVFDPHTHAFLGMADQSAVLEHAIVDGAGQRP